MYWRFTPAVELPFFSCPVSSSAATASPPAGGARCSATNRRITPIAVVVSHTASLSSRCIRSGVRSPACSASVQQFLRGRSLINPVTYLRACCSGSTRALPFFGIVTEIIPVFARKPLFGYATRRRWRWRAAIGAWRKVADTPPVGRTQLSWAVAGREWPDLRPRDRAGRRTSPRPGLRRARACRAPRTGVWRRGRRPARPRRRIRACARWFSSSTSASRAADDQQRRRA